MPIKLTDKHTVGRSVASAVARFLATVPDGTAYTLKEVGDLLGHHPEVIRRAAKDIGVYLMLHVPGEGAVAVVANPKTVKEKLGSAVPKLQK